MTVRLRRAKPTDAEFLFELIGDEETRVFLGGRTGESIEDVRADIERRNASRKSSAGSSPRSTGSRPAAPPSRS